MTQALDRIMKITERPPLVMVEGAGSWLWDRDGKRYLDFMSAYSAVSDDDAVLGVAIWLAPGRCPWSAWRQLRGAGWMLAVLRADPSSFRAFMKTGANGARLHPAYPHWYLETMGVDPAVQRRIGRIGGIDDEPGAPLRCGVGDDHG